MTELYDQHPKNVHPASRLRKDHRQDVYETETQSPAIRARVNRHDQQRHILDGGSEDGEGTHIIIINT